MSGLPAGKRTGGSISPPEPFGVNFFGYLTGDFGLAVAARTTLRVLLNTGTPVCTRNLPIRGGWKPRSGESGMPPKRAGLPYSIDFFHLNPSDFLLAAPLLWPHLPLDRRLNCMVPFWEIPALSEAHERAFAMMDFVLAPTVYIKEIIEKSCPGLRVLHFPQAVYLPPDIKPNRERWGLAEAGIVFISSFDLNSDINRKNPWGALEAFRKAFADGLDATLILKLHGADEWEGHAVHLRRLRAIAQGDPRIRLIEQRLDYADLLSLYASCDAFISLHKAEGLGLVGMEMMTLGKPVVATAWSGNMDYSTPENSLLVPYRMVPVDAVVSLYQNASRREVALWAEPDVEAAAAALRRLATEPELRFRLGAQGAADMERLRRRHSRGEVVRLLRRMHEQFDPSDPRLAERRRRVRGLRLRGPRILAGQGVRAVGRRVARFVRRWVGTGAKTGDGG